MEPPLPAIVGHLDELLLRTRGRGKNSDPIFTHSWLGYRIPPASPGCCCGGSRSEHRHRSSDEVALGSEPMTPVTLLAPRRLDVDAGLNSFRV